MNSRNYKVVQEENEIVLLNGRCVLNALVLSKNGVTEDELLDCFIDSTHQPHKVLQELQQILNKGVVHGFIVRNGDKYALPSLQNMHEADADNDDDGGDSE